MGDACSYRTAFDRIINAAADKHALSSEEKAKRLSDLKREIDAAERAEEISNRSRACQWRECSQATRYRPRRSGDCKEGKKGISNCRLKPVHP